MAQSLTLIAIKARQVIKYGIVAFFAIIFGRLLIIFLINAYNTLVPKPPPPPTVGFNRLAVLPFPEQTSELPAIQYTVNTPDGNLPKYPGQINVYYMPQKTANLFSFDRMKTLAASFGFTGAPLQISETQYSFNHPKVSSTFKADLIYESFSLAFNLAEDTSPLSQRAPDVSSATGTVTSALVAAQSKPEDLSGPVTHEYLRAEGQSLVTALSLSDAQLTKINLHRAPVIINEVEYPSVTADTKEANVWFIVSGSADRQKKLIAGEYHYFPIDYTRVETYPIKNTSEALEQLRAGGGYIANLGLNPEGEITIRSIRLAYYDPAVPYLFYQPVYSFEGDDGFVAYVPAVTSEYYGEETSE